MKTKFLGILITLIAYYNVVSAQYKFSLFNWQHTGINYSALIINNNGNHTARVNFKFDGADVILEYKIALEANPSYAPRDYVYAAKGDVKVIKGNANNLRGYVADNIFLLDYNKATNRGSKYVIIDNEGKGNPAARNLGAEVTYSKHFSSYNDLNANNISLTKYVLSNEPLYASITAGTNGAATANTPSVPNNNSSTGKVNVYVVLAGDVQCENIGRAVRQDLINMEKLFKENVAKDPRLNIIYTKITGSALTKEVISGKLKEIGSKNLSNDVVLFYYSGHGYNVSPMTSKFPRMALNSSATYNLEEIKNLINKYKPRTTIVIGDLCNSVANVRGKSVEDIQFEEHRGMTVIDTARIGRLFIHSSGSIVSTSSSYDEYSFCGGTELKPGGAFSLPFFKHFKNALYKGTPIKADWKAIFFECYKDAKDGTIHIKNKNGAKGQTGFNEGYINYKF